MTAGGATAAPPAPPPGAARAGFRAPRLDVLLIAWLAAAGVSYEIYRPALRGEFLSDDVGYLTNNPWVQRLAPDDVVAILDPWGGPASYSSNWAPVNLLLHGLEWKFFGARTAGYHAVNVGVHALVSVLLALVFLRAGIPPLAAWLAAGLFLVHPANVEAVAWISQFKTLASTAFALGALLAHPRRPLLGAALFVLAVLTKATAFFVLPVAAWWAFTARRNGEPAQRLGWLSGWAGLFLLYLTPQFTAFFRGNLEGATLNADPLIHLRTLFAIGARYLSMAFTGIGVAPFHQPPPAESITDPWWIAALVLGTAIGARALVTLRRFSVEGGFWIWAAFAYAPISQVFPFRYPMGDRYLYDVLPGLMGALLLAGASGLRRIDARRAVRGATPFRRATLKGVGCGAALLLAALFAIRSHAQAAIWQGLLPLTQAAAIAYPDGMNAHLLLARDAAIANDKATAVAELRAAADTGFDLFVALPREPVFGALRGDPEFQALVTDLAARWIELAKLRGYDSQPELVAWAEAYAIRKEWSEAVERLERAVALGGPIDALARERLVSARKEQAAQRDRAERPVTGPPASP